MDSRFQVLSVVIALPDSSQEQSEPRLQRPGSSALRFNALLLHPHYRRKVQSK